MILKDKLYSTPTWSKEQVLNRWCDYIELLCIDGKDGLVSKDDVIEMLSVEVEEKGSDSYAMISDKIVQQVNSMFEQISYRYNTIPNYYPFIYEDGCLCLQGRLNERHLLE